MIKITVNQAKAGFFDRDSVIKAADRATRTVLSKFGAFVRQTSRVSIKYVDRPSQPGHPPHGHKTMNRKKVNKKTGATTSTGVSPLKEFIFFSYDFKRKSVVIGPVKLNARSGEALPALEYGGVSRISRGRGRQAVVKVRARPFMNPAFEKELPGVPAMWADAIKK